MSACFPRIAATGRWVQAKIVSPVEQSYYNAQPRVAIEDACKGLKTAFTHVTHGSVRFLLMSALIEILISPFKLSRDIQISYNTFYVFSHIAFLPAYISYRYLVIHTLHVFDFVIQITAIEL